VAQKTNALQQFSHLSLEKSPPSHTPLLPNISSPDATPCVAHPPRSPLAAPPPGPLPPGLRLRAWRLACPRSPMPVRHRTQDGRAVAFAASPVSSRSASDDPHCSIHLLPVALIPVEVKPPPFLFYHFFFHFIERTRLNPDPGVLQSSLRHSASICRRPRRSPTRSASTGASTLSHTARMPTLPRSRSRLPCASEEAGWKENTEESRLSRPTRFFYGILQVLLERKQCRSGLFALAAWNTEAVGDSLTSFRGLGASQETS
jgi:hypothetical protein